MEELGGYRELDWAARVLGNLVFLGVLFLTALLERLQLQLKATEASRWWASNGRDVVNAFAFGAMWLGLKVIGFTGPIALAIAATLVVAMSVVQSSLAKYPRLSTALALGLTLAVGLPVILVPNFVHGVFRWVIEGLF
ncbi:MAG: hypothetical protein ACOZIN_14815 [Myxococcota bacterium]